MELPSQELCDKWQSFWYDLCRMAYYRENIVRVLEIYDDADDYKNCNYIQLTLDFAWRNISEELDSEGKFVEPQVVEELEELYVPRLLFETLGVYTWFKYSFPNCKIHFWEEE